MKRRTGALRRARFVDAEGRVVGLVIAPRNVYRKA